MRLTKRLFMLSALALVATALVPNAASAATGSCVLQGVTGDLQGPIAPVPTTGGSGTYTFASQGGTPGTQCSLNGAVPSASTITSSGRYTNTICGTGVAFGDGSTGDTVVRDAAGNTISNIRYRIDFFGGNGILDVTQVNGQPEVGAVDGYINITPDMDSGSSCAPGSGGVAKFRVVGAFTVEWGI